MKRNWQQMNDTQTVEAIDHELLLQTHNRVDKEDLIYMIKWLRNKVDEVVDAHAAILMAKER